MIRSISIYDAVRYGLFLKKLEEETNFLLLEVNERKTTKEHMEKMIDMFLKVKNSTILVAEKNGKLIGHILAKGGDANRNQHCVMIVIGILQEEAGKGVGKKLFHELENWAIHNEITRFELTVMTHNENALKLYKSVGFELEGTKRNSLKVNGEYVDEYYMSKLLDK
ncbi:GNAT family N-acetyltransferase [Alkalihalobacterium elongatum]|uniref:GNAT family N-acetyltransferase n=1 Tax=Alkalihalobacterium elongatum TaxID=2675466 RepID=UPI001C1F3E7F|nr:GNAT family N-acetyltransferase [Alkalihalobacterium elongatum]